MCAQKKQRESGPLPKLRPARASWGQDTEAGDVGGWPPAQRGAAERVGPCTSGDPLKTLRASAPDSEMAGMLLSRNSAAA